MTLDLNQTWPFFWKSLRRIQHNIQLRGRRRRAKAAAVLVEKRVCACASVCECVWVQVWVQVRVGACACFGVNVCVFERTTFVRIKKGGEVCVRVRERKREREMCVCWWESERACEREIACMRVCWWESEREKERDRKREIERERERECALASSSKPVGLFHKGFPLPFHLVIFCMSRRRRPRILSAQAFSKPALRKPSLGVCARGFVPPNDWTNRVRSKIQRQAGFVRRVSEWGKEGHSAAPTNALLAKGAACAAEVFKAGVGKDTIEKMLFSPSSSSSSSSSSTFFLLKWNFCRKTSRDETLPRRSLFLVYTSPWSNF